MRLLSFLFLLVLPAAHAESLQAMVTGIADGDSLYVLDQHQRRHEIRLLGIDAPELRQAFGQAAKQSLKHQLHGKTVQIEWHQRDRYGRLLGKVMVGNVDTGLHQVLSGMAWWNRKFVHDQSPDDTIRYRNAEFVARKKRLGLWSQQNPLPPWRWRFATPKQNVTVKP